MSLRPSRSLFAEPRRPQSGFSLLALLVVGGLLVFFATLAMRVVPSALEYMAIKSALEKVATSGSANSSREIQSSFDRFAAVDDITSITGKDLTIEKDASGATVISFAYEKRIPLYGPVTLLIDYQGSNRAR